MTIRTSLKMNDTKPSRKPPMVIFFLPPCYGRCIFHLLLGLLVEGLILNLQEALAIKIKLPKFEEANEIHGTRSKPWSTPHAHKYEQRAQ